MAELHNDRSHNESYMYYYDCKCIFISSLPILASLIVLDYFVSTVSLLRNWS